MQKINKAEKYELKSFFFILLLNKFHKLKSPQSALRIGHLKNLFKSYK